MQREVEAACNDKAVADEEDANADEAGFFGDDREDEVGAGFGQEFELRLRALHVAFAKEAARADGDFRLDDVVAVAEGVGFGVKQGQHAIALVVFDAEHPEERQGNGGERTAEEHDPARHAGEEEGDEAGSAHQERGAEVGFHQDEQAGDGDDEQGEDDAADARHGDAHGNKPGDHQRDGEFCQFGGLDAGDADVKPALGAARLAAEQEDEDEEDEGQPVGGRSQATDVARRHSDDGEQYAESGGEAQGLSHQDAFVAAAGAAQDEQAAAHQRQEAEQHWDVDAAQPFAHHLPYGFFAHVMHQQHGSFPAGSSLRFVAPRVLRSSCRRRRAPPPY